MVNHLQAKQTLKIAGKLIVVIYLLFLQNNCHPRTVVVNHDYCDQETSEIPDAPLLKSALAPEKQTSQVVIESYPSEVSESENSNKMSDREDVNPPKNDLLCDIHKQPLKTLSIASNPSIRRCIAYYTDKHPQDLVDGFNRGEQYFSMISGKIAERGLPQEIVWVPFVESGYRIRALSGAYAKGMWQLMPIIAREFGLRIDEWIDERIDPELSTDAALDMLEYLHRRTGDWLLAFAAYNSGEGRINRAIKVVGSRNYWDLAQSKQIPPQTRFYVSAILALQHITDNVQLYNLSRKNWKPYPGEIVHIDNQMDLHVIAECADMSLAAVKKLNPALKRQWTPPDYPKFPLRIPTGSRQVLQKKIAKISPNNYLRWVSIDVNAGDTLSHIAARYRSNVSEIMKANGLTGTLIRTGWTLMIPIGIVSR